jgi:hypothetical protein
MKIGKSNSVKFSDSFFYTSSEKATILNLLILGRNLLRKQLRYVSLLQEELFSLSPG